MSDLQNQTPADTYKGLLQVGDYTNGVDGNSEYVQDGEGTNSALSISTTKVGVGTVSPSAELDVNGNVVADEYALDGTGTSTSAVAIHAPATNELAIRTDSTERVRIDSSGQIGIGTTNPSKHLHIEDTNANTPGIKISASDQAYEHEVRANGDGILISADSTNYGGAGADIRFNVSSSEYMRIRKSGNVGIGTISPDAPLEVSSTTGGVIIPRMTTTQRDAISSPTDGEMIYNTTTNKFQGRANGAWVDFH